MGKRKPAKRVGPKLSARKIEALVSEAVVDAYGNDEQRLGFFTMIEDSLAVPFETTVLGIPVTVKAVQMHGDHDIMALCIRGRDRQRIPILELPLPIPRPAGWEWIEAYRHWACP